MIDVDIWKVRYFRDEKALERLNEHIALSHGIYRFSFQIHQIATATGCSLDAAISVLHYAVVAGALLETTIFYNKHTNEIVYMGELEKLEIVDDEQDVTLVETDLVWEPFFHVTKPANQTGWQFIKSK